ncbi:MAG: universal stress protein, partial [Vicinamibacterales bacterium]|nr:universal stress protein [Vicinamibacterales bacterium]
SVAPTAVMAEYPSTLSLTAVDRERVVEDVQRMATPLADAGITFAATVEDGDTVERVLHHAKARDCDLIVMGTHGSGGFERLLLGSISEKVLRQAPCPVLTIPPHDATEPQPHTIVFRNILCPVDFSKPSMRALSHALSLAEEADGKLTAVHILEWFADPEPPDSEEMSVPECRRVVESDARARLARAIPAEARQWCEADEVLTSGKPHREILRLAEAQSADVIVMGVHGRGALDMMMFGSVTNHVVRAATCPVLTVPNGSDGS